MAEGFSIKMETKKFNRNVTKLRRRYPDKTDVILKKFALDLLKNMVSNTSDYRHPVRTGRARAGWYPSAVGLDMPWSDEGSDVVAVLEGKGQGSYKERLNGLKKYIELVNSVKYILLLEYGSSTQAPWGILRINMRKMTGDKLPGELGKELQKEWRRFPR